MIIATTDTIPGCRITKTIGLVRGNTIRARHLGHDIMAGLKNLVGGEIDEYTKLMAEAREQSLDRLTAEAGALGADAVVGLRFTTSSVMNGASELLAYGTAVLTTEDAADA
ncbi:MAG: YbjQ family protein [Lentisphaeria bacterium]|nr:YbjQ family protein [Lentisphaeria bacterium]